jgi:hypothetical protein
VRFINSVSIRHFDFETILHRQLLDFTDQKIAEEVFGQKSVGHHSLVIIVNSFWLKNDAVRLWIIKMSPDTLHKAFVSQDDMLLEQLLETLWRWCINNDILVALYQLVVLQWLLEDPFLLYVLFLLLLAFLGLHVTLKVLQFLIFVVFCSSFLQNFLNF